MKSNLRKYQSYCNISALQLKLIKSALTHEKSRLNQSTLAHNTSATTPIHFSPYIILMKQHYIDKQQHEIEQLNFKISDIELSERTCQQKICLLNRYLLKQRN
jgi:hypothetical protein